jgi:hypothetical protein
VPDHYLRYSPGAICHGSPVGVGIGLQATNSSQAMSLPAYLLSYRANRTKAYIQAVFTRLNSISYKCCMRMPRFLVPTNLGITVPAIVKMSLDTARNIIGIIEMNSERNISMAFSGFFALLLYLLINAYNQYLTVEDKVSFFVAGICLLVLLIHQIRIVWFTSVRRKSNKR